MKLKDKGWQVEELQQALKDKGYDIKVDGDFGKKTEIVLKQFQSDRNLRVDGIAGNNTLYELGIGVFHELPRNGIGYTVYNRDGNDQFGTRKTIESVVKLGLEWFKLHPENPIQVGDISKKGGGDFPPHSTHRDGREVDVRPVNDMGKQMPFSINHPEYGDKSRELNRQLLKLFLKLNPRGKALFNDPILISEGLCLYWSSHNNHLHLMFR